MVEGRRTSTELPSFLRQAGLSPWLGQSPAPAVPVAAALLCQQGCGSWGCLGADGAERNVDLSALGLLFPWDQDAFAKLVVGRSPFPTHAAGRAGRLPMETALTAFPLPPLPRT